MGNAGSSLPAPSSEPWLDEFEGYVRGRDLVPEDVDMVEWWGVCSTYRLFLTCKITDNALDSSYPTSDLGIPRM